MYKRSNLQKLRNYTTHIKGTKTDLWAGSSILANGQGVFRCIRVSTYFSGVFLPIVIVIIMCELDLVFKSVKT